MYLAILIYKYLAISNLFNYLSDINKLIKDKEAEKLVNIKSAIIDMYNVLGLFEQDYDFVINEIKNKKSPGDTIKLKVYRRRCNYGLQV